MKSKVVKTQKTKNKIVAKKGTENFPEFNQALKKYGSTLRLDIGCGANKQDGFAGIDYRPGDTVDFVHNLEKFPWPLPDESVSFALASHVLEHINPGSTDPKLVSLIDLLLEKRVIKQEDVTKFIGEYHHLGTFIRFMDEVWRILEPGGRFIFVVPYAGSQGFFQDPTHINPINETTLAYFDPMDQSNLWHFYKPKPWKILDNVWNNVGNLEVKLEKRPLLTDYQPNK